MGPRRAHPFSRNALFRLISQLNLLPGVVPTLGDNFRLQRKISRYSLVVTDHKIKSAGVACPLGDQRL